MSRTVELKLFIVLYYAVMHYSLTKLRKKIALVSVFCTLVDLWKMFFFPHEPQPQRPMTFGESTEATKDRGV